MNVVLVGFGLRLRSAPGGDRFQVLSGNPTLNDNRTLSVVVRLWCSRRVGWLCAIGKEFPGGAVVGDSIAFGEGGLVGDSSFMRPIG